MEDTYFRFLSVVEVNRFENKVVVADKGRNIVILLWADSIPTVVSEIVDDQIKIVGQQRPEGIVEINRQTIAVAQHEPRPRRISMTTQNDGSIIVDANFASGKRLGYFPDGF